MKLSYREKIGLLIFIVAVVIIIFIAWPIKTIRANIETHTTERDNIKIKYDETKRLVAQIPTIENNITKLYTEVEGLSEEFTVHRENFEIDKFVQEIINKSDYIDGDKNKMEVDGDFVESDAEASELEFYYFKPDVVVYPILEAADTNGNLMESTDKELYDRVTNALIIDELEPQNVEIHNAEINMRFTKDALFAFEDELKKLDTGIRITSVTIDDYRFGSLSEIPEDVGYSDGKVTFSFYTMQKIQEPVFKD